MRIESGTVEVIEIVVALVLKIALGLWLVGWDERRIAKRRPEWFERAYPPASKLSAIVVFQEIGVVLHFIRTRGGVRGVAVGLAWGVAYVFAVSCALFAVELLLGVESS